MLTFSLQEIDSVNLYLTFFLLSLHLLKNHLTSNEKTMTRNRNTTLIYPILGGGGGGGGMIMYEPYRINGKYPLQLYPEYYYQLCYKTS